MNPVIQDCIRINVHKNRQYESINLGPYKSKYFVDHVVVKLISGDKKTKTLLHKIDNKTCNVFKSVTNECKLEVVFKEEGSKEKVTLPDTIGMNLITFLRLFRPAGVPNFDCLKFVHELFFGRGQVISGREGDMVGRLESFDENPENLSIGDIVFLNDGVPHKDRNFYISHYAMYIGQSCYLSLVMSRGPLIITDLKQMKLGFETHQIAQKYIPDPSYFVRDAR